MNEAVSAPTPPDRETPVVVVTALAHTLCHMAELVFAGALLAIMAEFRLEPHEATALGLLGFVLMGAGALPVGFWSDAWGPTRLLRFYLAATAVSALAVALAPGTLGLFATLTCLGLVGSIYHPAALALLSVDVAPSSRGRAMGINGVAGSVGVALGPALGLVAAQLGMWRMAYVLLALFALGLFVYMLLTVRVPEGEGPSAAAVSAGPLPLAAGPGWRLQSLFFLAMMLGGFNYRCLMTALPTYLTGETAADGELARGGLLVLIAVGMGGFGQYYCGHGADRVGARRIYPWLIGLLIPLSLLLGLSGGGLLAFPVACLVAVCLFGQQPVENTIMAEWAPSSRRGLSYALKFAATFGVGAVGAHVVGMLWDEFNSLAATFYVMAASSALMASLAVYLLWRTAPRAEKPCTAPGAGATIGGTVPAVHSG
jgi:MFS family permease